jgi:hypothetical protein
VRAFDDDANIDILTGGAIVSGPGGTLDNSFLDGGTSSSHGSAVFSSLPAGAVSVFSQTDPSSIVDFYFAYGEGWV